MRTLPFKLPLNSTGYDGVYLKCRFVSDSEPQKRVWKISLRTDTSRGEQVYQSQFTLFPPAHDDEWTQVALPFDSFRLVRGARLVTDDSGSRAVLDRTKGIYQIGITMSKFVMAGNLTAMEDFRAGFFELHIESIGLYLNDTSAVSGNQQSQASFVETLTAIEARENRSLLVKLLLPVTKLFFSEKANRRKSAMNILRGDKRNLSRMGAIMFGMRLRAKSKGVFGMLLASIETFKIIGVDLFRTILFSFLKFVFILVGSLRKVLNITLGTIASFGRNVHNFVIVK